MEGLKFVAILATLFAAIGFLGFQIDSPIAILGAQIAASSLLILGVVATIIGVNTRVITLRKAS
jgi:hypothetical protein